MRALDAELDERGLAPQQPGKGRNVWYCGGYVQASGRGTVVALHDCDILTYERGMLARLFYPVAHPHLNYEFCKGFYPRIAEGRLNGRVSRLMVTPLLRALKRMHGPLPYLEYLDSYRYALSGEFSMRTEVLDGIRIPADWRLEIGVLSEVHRNYSTKLLCQVDLADAYDHKLPTQGVIFSAEGFRTLKATYYRLTLDLIEAYDHDAVMNGLSLDRHGEEHAVKLFAANLLEAGNTFWITPASDPSSPAGTESRRRSPTYRLACLRPWSRTTPAGGVETDGFGSWGLPRIT
ncbi:hypothetical protein [Marinobacter sp. ELB17]|uniref:hypothetical protein n=1 Tax=Marinobacter sp. ELB17 TaxID=270374 RepID=UPI0000F3B5A5|nr:hypothetical protein [Marinobacter sp. ELB17]EAZ97504.1 Glycosyltransferase involved in cell wall biogenesis [Marinobacter sp. ELB17]